MRPLVAVCLLVVSVTAAACAGPHSTGAAWSLQDQDQEMALYQVSDAQRSDIAHAFELNLADDALQAERQRITTELQNCPGPAQPLGVSPGDTLRDQIRVRAQTDPARLAQVAQLALADWYVRRASASGNVQYCQRAQAALDGTLAPDSPGNLLDALPATSVARHPGDPTPPLTTDPPLVTLSEYALGLIDTVYAEAPLPPYLARVYGGSVSSSVEPAADSETAADMVDRQAPAYPNWEPDALYAALRGGLA